MVCYDDLQTRSADQRAADLARDLPAQALAVIRRDGSGPVLG